jgi:hypothetical protein
MLTSEQLDRLHFEVTATTVWAAAGFVCRMFLILLLVGLLVAMRNELHQQVLQRTHKPHSAQCWYHTRVARGL